MITRATASPNAGKVIQKLILYLILANFALTGVYIMFARGLTFGINIVLTCLLILYNVLLCRLVCQRARRVGDGYIIYPVVSVAIILCAVVLFHFIIYP
ncbi:MAG: hypothetical protein ACRCWL_05955 [Aeromonas sp.]